jgi:hypothetical protein
VQPAWRGSIDTLTLMVSSADPFCTRMRVRAPVTGNPEPKLVTPAGLGVSVCSFKAGQLSAANGTHDGSICRTRSGAVTELTVNCRLTCVVDRGVSASASRNSPGARVAERDTTGAVGPLTVRQPQAVWQSTAPVASVTPRYRQTRPSFVHPRR